MICDIEVTNFLLQQLRCWVRIVDLSKRQGAISLTDLTYISISHGEFHFIWPFLSHLSTTLPTFPQDSGGSIDFKLQTVEKQMQCEGT